MQFKTKTGTTWVVSDGRITRLSETPVPNAPTVTFNREPLAWIDPSVVGQRCRFEVKSIRGSFSTALVVDINR